MLFLLSGASIFAALCVICGVFIFLRANQPTGIDWVRVSMSVTVVALGFLAWGIVIFTTMSTIIPKGLVD